MDYTPLAEPFSIQFEKDGVQYKGKVVYAKSAGSCANLFSVTIEWPGGIEPFCLKEQPVHEAENNTMVWIDEQGRESIFYQLIGNEIASQMKRQLGIFLLDTPISSKQESRNS